MVRIFTVGYERLEISKDKIRLSQAGQLTEESLKEVTDFLLSLLHKFSSEEDPVFAVEVSGSLTSCPPKNHCGHHWQKLLCCIESDEETLKRVCTRARDFVQRNINYDGFVSIILIDKLGDAEALTLSAFLSAVIRYWNVRLKHTDHMFSATWRCRGNCETCERTNDLCMKQIHRGKMLLVDSVSAPQP